VSRRTRLLAALVLVSAATGFADDAGIEQPALAADSGVKSVPTAQDAGARAAPHDGGHKAAATTTDAGSRPAPSPSDAGSKPTPSPADAGARPTPDAGTHPSPADAGTKAGPADAGASAAPVVDAGVGYAKVTGGSQCKMTRKKDNQVLVERHSSGSILDCQQEVRTEVRAKFCKESRERIEVSFSGEFNGIAVEPISLHIACPRRDAPK